MQGCAVGRWRSAAPGYPSALVPVGTPGTPDLSPFISPAPLIFQPGKMAAIAAAPALHTVPRARAVSRAAAVPSRSFAAQLRPQQRRAARAVRVFAEQSTKAGEPSGRAAAALDCCFGVQAAIRWRPMSPPARQQPAGTRARSPPPCPLVSLHSTAPCSHSWMAGAGAVTDSTWEELVLKSPVPVLVSRQAGAAGAAQAAAAVPFRNAWHDRCINWAAAKRRPQVDKCRSANSRACPLGLNNLGRRQVSTQLAHLNPAAPLTRLPSPWRRRWTSGRPGAAPAA